MIPRVIYRPTGVFHLVVASGVREDGPLVGRQTWCGRQVGREDQWMESAVADPKPLCYRCRQAAGPAFKVEAVTG